MSAGGLSPLPREARAFQGRRAGIVSRLAAAVLDTGVVAVLLAALYAAVAAARFAVAPLHFTFPPLSPVVSLAVALTLLVLYLAASWTVTGRTYGCHVMGLRVVTVRGTPLRPLHALVRAASCALFPLGLLWCAVSRDSRSLQDAVLRTSVVYDWQPALRRQGW